MVAIDWPRRYRLMRLHFAAELVLELMHQHFPAAEKIGADITPEKARIDFRWAGSIAEAFPLLAREVQRLVDADLPIASEFDDAAAQRRYWEIAGFARVLCGGTHPRRTSEIGGIALKRVNPARARNGSRFGSSTERTGAVPVGLGPNRNARLRAARRDRGGSPT